MLDFEPDGLVEVTSRVPSWARIGFLKIPADWLPSDVVQIGTVPGEVIARQIPPEFTLAGLATTSAGLDFQLV